MSDGTPVRTASSLLLPVTRHGVPIMLKVTSDPDELRGGCLMTLWAGQGAARVIEHDKGALLLERAVSGRSLADLVYADQDDDATRYLCQTAELLHSVPLRHPEQMRPLKSWFADLLASPSHSAEWVQNCARQAHSLLSAPQEQLALHGDLHHGNVLDFGTRGWCAIDPKGLYGERVADFAALFLNPDLADSQRPYAISPHRFEQRVRLVSSHAKLDAVRLLQWIHAWSGLSAVWFIEDGIVPETQKAVADLALKALS
ncbi:streptomycin 3''-phosphotransferase [Acetobacter cibinongensis]|uniref:Aminoglycoside/hydroxyurea antibiotic resistance kinase n=1 Tax=Acetobacter cibinongensis TaxID=146475 RepID=A0A0D6MZI0_9PROT|nr:aminoglycoside phosphotransferase family protein [Acetobacter cibinongensis]GAN59089.1 aminoglycoside/hydroxyurea antibiotic resistance kinase [Acetobacter cibinongensis]GEL58953.1 streptomycin 3''-phosphotransferase [Acetobacter cibinongensis]